MNQLVKIQHKTFGTLVQENFADPIQFKIFLQTINGCLKSNCDLDFFNGVNFLIHLPYDILKECVIIGKSEPETLTEQMLRKSSIEGI